VYDQIRISRALTTTVRLWLWHTENETTNI